MATPTALAKSRLRSGRSLTVRPSLSGSRFAPSPGGCSRSSASSGAAIVARQSRSIRPPVLGALSAPPSPTFPLTPLTIDAGPACNGLGRDRLDPSCLRLGQQALVHLPPGPRMDEETPPCLSTPRLPEALRIGPGSRLSRHAGRLL